MRFLAKAVSALDALGEYTHVDVLQDGEIREGIKAYGDWPTIPQLYIGGELVGGSDIILQMLSRGELHTALGLPEPDRTPPSITITPAALEMLKQAIADAGAMSRCWWTSTAASAPGSTSAGRCRRHRRRDRRRARAVRPRRARAPKG